jgi:c-di-GMP-binding flagellar brake protein YcgR
VPNEYLIIQGQFYDIEEKLCRESKTTARYVHEGIVCAFSSQLIEVIATPVELGFLTYPEKIEPIQLRSNRRIECFLPAELVIRGDKYQVVIRDISEGGCRLRGKLPKGKTSLAIARNDQLTLVAQLPEDEHAQIILGEVRRIQFLSDFDAEEMDIGVKFHKRGLENLKTIIEQGAFA